MIQNILKRSLKSRVGAPANYNYQSATCPPDPSTLEITELNSKKCSVAPNSLRVSYHNSVTCLSHDTCVQDPFILNMKPLLALRGHLRFFEVIERGRKLGCIG